MRGSLTMPHSIASIREKSLTVQGNSVPSAIAGAAQEERRGGQVVEGGDPELALDRLQAGDPEPRGFAVLLGLFALVGGQFLVAVGLFAVAVVRFVVQHDDALDAQQFVGDTMQHLAVVLDRLRRRVAALEQ